MAQGFGKRVLKPQEQREAKILKQSVLWVKGDDRAAAINAIGFQLFRIKPFGLGLQGGKFLTPLQGASGFPNYSN